MYKDSATCDLYSKLHKLQPQPSRSNWNETYFRVYLHDSTFLPRISFPQKAGVGALKDSFQWPVAI